VQHGSGWVLDKVLKVRLDLCQYILFGGGCLKSQLPINLRKKKAIICLSGDSVPSDNRCFYRSVALALTCSRKKRNISRLTLLDRQLLRAFPSFDDSLGITLKDVRRFEKETNISINVYSYSSGKIFPCYISSWRTSTARHVKLLLHNRHYYAIRDLSALVKPSRKKTSKVFVCDYCLATFSKQQSWVDHQSLCTREGKRYQLPTKPQYKQFDNFRAITAAPFVIYADLECYMKEQSVEGLTSKQKSKTPHECMSWGSLTVCRDRPDWSSDTVLYTGPDAIKRLLDHLLKEMDRIQAYISSYNIPLVMTREDWTKFDAQTNCNICSYPFDMMNHGQKVRDHNHFTGTYRQALCNICNLKYAIPSRKVFVLFHGLSNYDSHFIIRHLHAYADKDIKVIPRTSEKYLSFSLKDLVFKDSFNFLSASLEKLSDHLRSKGPQFFKCLQRFVPDSKQRSLLFGKGVFPYTYIQSLDVLDETSLPPMSAFFNDLTQRSITTKEYEFAQDVWQTFQCQTLKDYLHVYLRSDVLLLADVFENFRANCLVDYHLDPIYYFSSAHFTFDAFLKHSQVSLELVSDVNQYLLFHKMIRGGLSVVSKRYSSQSDDLQLKYFDANNLYGWAMTQPLPCGNFKWIPFDQFQETLDSIFQDRLPSDRGFILEVDLDYPKRLHDWHNDFPLAPEKKIIREQDMSPYAKMLMSKHKLKCSKSVSKLVATLNPKRNYVLYYKNLQLYTRLGMVLTKTHKILSFTQKPIMREYIQFNSNKRAQATNDFDVNFYKFLSNSLFGKTMERPENKTHLKLVKDPDLFDRLVGKTNFKQRKIIHSDLAAVEMSPTVFKVQKPFYIGAVILELAKYHMYSFHYDVMKQHLGDKLTLLYTDTDSLIYEIKTSDINTTLQPIASAFDFSNYPTNHPLYTDRYKRVPGYFKDEVAGNSISAFVGLRSKMYAIDYEITAPDQDESINSEVKHAKGVKKHVIDHSLTFADYLDCLISETQMEHDFHTIASKSHHVFTSHQSKTSLSCFEDKRWLKDPINSLAYGHYRIPKNKLGEASSPVLS
jgi:hypothetical protein